MLRFVVGLTDVAMHDTGTLPTMMRVR